MHRRCVRHTTLHATPPTRRIQPLAARGPTVRSIPAGSNTTSAPPFPRALAFLATAAVIIVNITVVTFAGCLAIVLRQSRASRSAVPTLAARARLIQTALALVLTFARAADPADLAIKPIIKHATVAIIVIELASVVRTGAVLTKCVAHSSVRIIPAAAATDPASRRLSAQREERGDRRLPAASAPSSSDRQQRGGFVVVKRVRVLTIAPNSESATSATAAS